jgi:hypothetical protein
LDDQGRATASVVVLCDDSNELVGDFGPMAQTISVGEVDEG